MSEVVETWTTVVRNVALAAAAASIMGAYVALGGLKTWRRQLRGTAEYEFARRLLLAALKARDQIASARNSFTLQAG